MLLAGTTGKSLPNDTAVDTQRSLRFEHPYHQQADTALTRWIIKNYDVITASLYYPTCRSRVGRKYINLGLIYARTCRVRNGYSTGHVDVSYTCYLMKAFMLQRDGLAPGMCAQRGPFSKRRWRFFCRARHHGASVASTYLISRPVRCKRSRCLLSFAGATMQIPLIKV
jgi:hypothetical protein